MHTSDLDELILAFESEKANLEAQLKEALDESDYHFAITCGKGLADVKKMLESLRHFKDPDAWEKNSLEQTIRMYDRFSAIPGYHHAELSTLEARLKTLHDKPSGVVPNENELTDVLYDLIEGKNAGFRLQLKKAHGFFIEFRLIDKTMLLSFPRKSSRDGDDLNRNWKAIARLGFEPNGERMECRYQLNGRGDVTAIKVLLARLLFEHTVFMQYDRPAIIEFL